MRRRTRIFHDDAGCNSSSVWRMGWLRLARGETPFGWRLAAYLTVPKRFHVSVALEPICLYIAYSPYVAEHESFVRGCGTGWSWTYCRWPFLKTGPNGDYVRLPS